MTEPVLFLLLKCEAMEHQYFLLVKYQDIKNNEETLHC